MPTPQPQNNAVVQYARRDYPSFALEHRIHCMPVDYEEEERYEDLNTILQQLLGGGVRGLVLPDIDLDDEEVLDCGYGKGVWIEQLLEHFGDAEVTGVDIFTGGHGNENGGDEEEEEEEEQANNDDEDQEESAIELYIRKRWNLNAPFREDTSEDRLRPETFQFINSRMLMDGIDAARWPVLVRELHALLKPGGWLQMVEFHAIFQSDCGREAPFLQRWWEYYQTAMTQMGREPRIAPRLRQFMVDAGFRDLQSYVTRLPVGGWDPARQVLGQKAVGLLGDMIRDASLYPFLAVTRMSLSDYQNLIRGCVLELNNPELKLYLNVHVAYGRKSSRRR